VNEIILNSDTFKCCGIHSELHPTQALYAGFSTTRPSDEREPVGSVGRLQSSQPRERFKEEFVPNISDAGILITIFT
jgi:hypothetical protein